MAQTLINADMIANEALMQLENNLAMGMCVHRDYKKEWEGVKKGSTVRIRRPVKFDVTDGETATRSGFSCSAASSASQSSSPSASMATIVAPSP